AVVAVWREIAARQVGAGLIPGPARKATAYYTQLHYRLYRVPPRLQYEFDGRAWWCAAPDQKSSPTASPAARVAAARQAAWLTPLETKRTEPSMSRMFTPPVW